MISINLLLLRYNDTAKNQNPLWKLFSRKVEIFYRPNFFQNYKLCGNSNFGKLYWQN